MALRKQRLSSDQRREHLLDVAAAILLEDGGEALTMEAVRQRGRISRGLGYVHFANADELALALYEREMAELDRRLAVIEDAAAAFEARIGAWIRVYFDFIAERGGLLGILQAKLTGRWFAPSVRDRLAHLFGYWSRQLERELGVSTQVAGSLARTAVAACETLALAWRSDHLSRPRAEALAVAFILAGVRAAAAIAEP